MKKLNIKLEGSSTIWIFYILISVISVLIVFSASTLIVSMQESSYISFIIKHIFISIIGFIIVYTVHKLDYRYFFALSKILIFISCFMLLYLFIMNNYKGIDATRWIRVPIINMTFQPSVFANFCILIFTSRYLIKKKHKEFTFKYFFINLVIPVGIVLLLILPFNFSTSFLGFMMFFILLFIGGEKLKHLFILIFSAVLVLGLFIIVSKIVPNILHSRLNTWENRINNFFEGGNKYDYQIEKSKAAVYSGGIKGLGPGKSIQKHFLPQSNTDFIFAVIVEEYGIIGAIIIVTLYLLFFFRVIVLISKNNNKQRKILLIASSMPIIFSAFINIGVAISIIPVTGQPLPFISSGGTTVLVYSVCIGIILSISKETE